MTMALINMIDHRLSLNDFSPGVLALFTLPAFLLFWALGPRRSEKVPFVDGRTSGELFHIGSQRRFAHHGAEIVKAAQSRVAQAFYIITSSGRKLVLSGEYADELRSHPHLSHGQSLENNMCTSIPGFEPLSNGRRHGPITNDIVMKLTRALARVTEPVSEESALTLLESWTDQRDWHDISLQETIYRMIAQVSARVFVGKELCRNPAWGTATANYTSLAFVALNEVRKWPRSLQGIVHWVLPSARAMRAGICEVRALLTPIVERRRVERARQAQQGTPAHVEEEFSLLDCIEDSADQGTGYDPAISELAFQLAAIHTTCDLLGKLIVIVDSHPEILAPLREEVISVIGHDGWEKTSLYKLKLMDSVIKETQRLYPASNFLMKRVAIEDVQLKDGLHIPKGTNLTVTTYHNYSSDHDPEIAKFDAYRFVRMRENPAEKHKANLVTPSVESMGFGYGDQACPGRFFAANEIKIFFCHMLLKYDWKVAAGCSLGLSKSGDMIHLDHGVRLDVRRRKEEISL